MAYFQRNSPFYDPSVERKTTHGAFERLSAENGSRSRESLTGASSKELESHSFKVQEGWRNHVHKQGDLFYVEVNDPNKQIDNFTHGVSNWDKGHNTGDDLDDEYVSLNTVQHPTHVNGYIDTTGLSDVRTNIKNAENNNNHKNLQNGKPFKPKILFSDRGSDENSSINSDSSHLSPSLKSSLPSQQTSTPKSSKIKHVNLMPNLRNCRNGDSSGIVLCEKLFGIILCQYNSKSQQRNGSNLERIVRDRKIIVQDVVPGSGAESCGKIHRGDMLVCVNDEEISWVNLDLMFRSVPNAKMKLTFQAPVVVGPKQPVQQRGAPQVPPKTYLNTVSNSPITASAPPKYPVKKRPLMGENILHLVSGEETPGSSVFLRNCLCTVMYLTLDTSEGPESVGDDVVYQFPADNNKLTEIRGLFLTLCGVVPDVTGDSVKCCAMDYEGVKINMMFMKEGQDLFVIGAPESRIPPHTLSILMSELQQITQVLFGSISGAFRVPKNKSQLDQLFSLALHSALQNPEVIHHGALTSHSSKAYTDSVAGVRQLNLSDENKLLCDEILSEYEAADFDDYLDNSKLHERRSFTILGSCLFYKEYLLCSHLSTTDLRDLHLFMKHHGLLHLVSKQTVEELVIWREVYPTRWCHKCEPSPPGYSEPRGRWFLLIVGMKHYLLGTLLEVGGCTKSFEGNSGPDSFYVGQAKATLVQFESDDSNISECCENRLNSELHGPSLVSADSILSGHKPKKDDTIHLTPLKPQGSPRILANPTVSPTGASVFKWPASPYYEPRHGNHDDSEADRLSHGRGTSSNAGSDTSTPVMRRQGSKISYGSNDSSGSGNSNKGKQVSKAGSTFDINSLHHASISEDRILQNIKVCDGADNTLFHFVSFSTCEGVYLGPTPQELASSQGAVQYQVLQNFYKACLQIRTVFHRKTSVKEAVQNKIVCKLGHNSSFDAVQEHGLLFHYTPLVPQDSKKTPPSLDYWVVGRMCSDGREVYVCFHDSVPQSVVEIAFRVGFGT